MYRYPANKIFLAGCGNIAYDEYDLNHRPCMTVLIKQRDINRDCKVAILRLPISYAKEIITYDDAEVMAGWVNGFQVKVKSQAKFLQCD